MESQVKVRQSGFVTVVAWIFIVLSGFVILSSLLQIVLINYVYPAMHMQNTMQAIMHNRMPPLTRFIMAHHLVFNLIFLTLSIAMFVTSIALLKRKNWARVSCIVFLVIGIVWELVSFYTALGFYGHMPELPGNLPPQYKMIQQVSYIFSMVLAVVLCIAFVWIIKRLSSAKIRAEFVI